MEEGEASYIMSNLRTTVLAAEWTEQEIAKLKRNRPTPTT